jgi:hypothetical protein
MAKLHDVDADSKTSQSSYIIQDVGSMGGEILGLDIENDLVLLLRSRGLEVVDFSKPAHPVLLSRMNMPDQTTDMAVYGKTAYVGVRWNGVHIIDFSHPRALCERGLITTNTMQINLAVDGAYLRVWPHYKGDGDVEYLRTDRKPWQPEWAMEEDPRHMDRFAFLDSIAFYMQSYWHDNETRLQIIKPEDMKRQTVLKFPPRGDFGETKLMVNGKHGAVVTDDRLYLLDLSHPRQPIIAGSALLPQLKSTDYISRGVFLMQYLLLEGFKPTLIDIADPGHPLVMDWKSPHPIEQAWMIGNLLLARLVIDDATRSDDHHRRYQLAAFDLSNPMKPEERAVPLAESYRQIHLHIRGEMAYTITPEGELKILDCSFPRAIRLRGTLRGLMPLDEMHQNRLWEVHGSRLFVMDQKDVKVIDLINPDRPTILGAYRAAAYQATHVALEHTSQGRPIAWVANESGRLEGFDPAQPLSAQLRGTIDFQGRPNALKIEGQIACLGAGNKIFIFDIHQPESPMLINTMMIRSEVKDLALTGHLLLAVSNSDGLIIMNIKDPTSPRRVGSYSPLNCCRKVAARGNWVFLIGDELEIINVTNPAQPRFVKQYNRDEANLQIIFHELHEKTAYIPELIDFADSKDNEYLANAGRFVYFLNQRSWSGGMEYTLSVYDEANPLQPVKLNEYNRLIDTKALAADEVGNLFIADGEGGLLQLRIEEKAGISKRINKLKPLLPN